MTVSRPVVPKTNAAAATLTRPSPGQHVTTVTVINKRGNSPDCNQNFVRTGPPTKVQRLVTATTAECSAPTVTTITCAGGKISIATGNMAPDEIYISPDVDVNYLTSPAQSSSTPNPSTQCPHSPDIYGGPLDDLFNAIGNIENPFDKIDPEELPSLPQEVEQNMTENQQFQTDYATGMIDPRNPLDLNDVIDVMTGETALDAQIDYPAVDVTVDSNTPE